MRRYELILGALCGILLAVVAATAIGAPQEEAGRTIEVVIDIKPGDEPTTVDPRRDGMLPVAVLSSASFAATTIDPSSVRFGDPEEGARPVRSMQEDVDDDGRIDLIFLFRNRETGIRCGATSATLRGRTRDGVLVRGSEEITTVGCRRR